MDVHVYSPSITSSGLIDSISVWFDPGKVKSSDQIHRDFPWDIPLHTILANIHTVNNQNSLWHCQALAQAKLNCTIVSRMSF